MKWALSGKRAEAVDPSINVYADTADGTNAGKPVSIGNEQYLVRNHYLVPYLQPEDRTRAFEREQRDRLNLELCDRVFRISDVRDVTRGDAQADEGIAALMAAYLHSDLQAENTKQTRGLGKVLFGRIVSRIRDLSQNYLETGNPQAMVAIQSLYSFVMIEHCSIFSCVRLHDDSVDYDGIIEEIFSEIGKPQRQSLESIYASRALKISDAMAGMNKVAYLIDQALYRLPNMHLGDLQEKLESFTSAATRVVGIPSSDALVYDDAAIHYVDDYDRLNLALFNAETKLKSSDIPVGFFPWLRQGTKLIHSMQHIRDSRKQSIQHFADSANFGHKHRHKTHLS